jgi:hypothetical protein
MIEGSSADHWLSTITALGFSVLGGEDQPRSAIGDLRAVAGGDLAPRPLEGGLERGELVDRGIRPHAIVLGIDLAGAVEGGLDFVGEPTFRLRLGQPPVALDRVFVGFQPRDVEELRQHLGGLAHVQLDHRIGEAALEPDDRREKRGPEREEVGDALPNGFRREHAAEPLHRRAAIDERRVAQRLGAAGEHEIGNAVLNVAVRRVDRLHAGAAIDLHGESGHALAHAEAQRRDARRVHLVGNDVDAAEDHLIEVAGRERLAQQ